MYKGDHGYKAINNIQDNINDGHYRKKEVIRDHNAKLGLNIIFSQQFTKSQAP
jgi:hypothetical protein